MSQKQFWDKEYAKGTIWHRETKLPDLLKGKSVLELGVGNGKTLISIIRQKPKDCLAIDFSEEAINKCKSNFNYNNLTLKCIDMRGLKIRKKFDIIICYYFLNNFLEKDRTKVANKIKSLVNNKGKIIFEDFAQGDLREKGNFIEEHTIERENGIICHFFNTNEIKKLFGKNAKIEEKAIKTKYSNRKIISGIISN